MYHFQGEALQPVLLAQGLVQAARGVLAEHQVLSVGQGEGLFIGAFDRRLQGSAQGGLGAVQPVQQWQILQSRVQVQLQARLAALAVRGGEDAL